MDEEVEFTILTQYSISGSTPVISRVNGGIQVRAIVEDDPVILSEPTAER